MTREADPLRLSSLDDPTRRELFDYVATQQAPVSRAAAAEAVGVDRSVAAYHLDRLVADGLVTASYFRPHGRGGPGAGRPAKHYEPSDVELVVTVPPRDYRLAAELLARAVAADPDPQAPVRTALESAARELGRELAGEDRGDAAGDAARDAARGDTARDAARGDAARGASREAAEGDAARVDTEDGDGDGDDEPRARLVGVLAGLGFRPYEDAEGATRLGNCPFSRLAEAQPDLTCGMNLALLTGVAEAVGAGTEPALDSAAGDCCVVLRRCHGR